MILDHSLWEAREGLPALLAALDAADDATRLVGGAVRDTLLDLPVADLDLATRYPPEETRARIVRAGFKAVPTGLRHGTVTAVLPSGPVEVTTLRRDVATDGRHAVVAFTDDWREDAARRDFTINALFARTIDGAVIDCFEGLTDLAARRVRFIGDPLQRIAEDHLRILRFFRFHARFGAGDPDAAGLAACAARANDLMALSRERVRDELLKLLVAPRAVATLRLMADHGILAALPLRVDLEEIASLARLVEAEAAAGLPPDPIRRLAALCLWGTHNIESVARDIKLSNAQRERVVRDCDRNVAARSAEALAYELGREVAVDRLLLAGDVEGAIRLVGWQRPHFPLTGGALIARGVPAGPLVARTLRLIERRWAEEDFPPIPRLDALARAAVTEALATPGAPRED